MRNILIIAGAFALGGYSVVGAHYYSLLQSRTKNSWVRLCFAIVATALFTFLPMVGCMFLLSAGSVPSTVAGRVVWLVSVFLCWSGTLWFYLIENWTVFQSRLRGAK